MTPAKVAELEHTSVERYGAAWCDVCDTAWTRCSQQLATDVDADSPCAGISIESATFACWVACPCGFTGPKRRGTPDDVAEAIYADRARHLAGLPLDEPVDPAPAPELLLETA